MAQFRATVQGNRSEASRLGHKTSGITTRCNGWKSGVRVEGSYYEDKDADVFTVYATAGSGYGTSAGMIAQVTKDEEGKEVIQYYFPNGLFVEFKDGEVSRASAQLLDVFRKQ